MNSLIRKDDFLFPIQQHFDRFFEEFFQPASSGKVRAAAGFPKMDIFEYHGCFEINAAISGWKNDEIEVEVTKDNLVTISGKKKAVSGYCPKTHHLRELRYSEFSRAIQLPDTVEGDPEATIRDGILTLRWKTKEQIKEEPHTKKIQIKSED